jgi:hypothetical protein
MGRAIRARTRARSVPPPARTPRPEDRCLARDHSGRRARLDPLVCRPATDLRACRLVQRCDLDRCRDRALAADQCGNRPCARPCDRLHESRRRRRVSRRGCRLAGRAGERRAARCVREPERARALPRPDRAECRRLARIPRVAARNRALSGRNRRDRASLTLPEWACRTDCVDGRLRDRSAPV